MKYRNEMRNKKRVSIVFFALDYIDYIIYIFCIIYRLWIIELVHFHHAINNSY